MQFRCKKCKKLLFYAFHSEKAEPLAAKGVEIKQPTDKLCIEIKCPRCGKINEFSKVDLIEVL